MGLDLTEHGRKSVVDACLQFASISNHFTHLIITLLIFDLAAGTEDSSS